MTSIAELTVADVCGATAFTSSQFYGRCHAVSLALVKSGLLDQPARVARGFADGVAGQHSWVVLGDDCFSRSATVVDPTLWANDSSVEGIFVGANRLRHYPHGGGSIFASGMPHNHHEGVVELAGYDELSERARSFLSFVLPLDRRGWHQLLTGPVEGWPAGEIIEAALCTPELAAIPPVDYVGMLTQRNPGGLYW